ncbi:MAG: hypothetical protein ACK4TD_13660 [Ectopseudomonas guguanensis]|uniref:hypothetical protein n=1 Tax=Ectopseudomonas guguanensis TaxID=1198456 RepID=UPI0015CED514
MERFVSFFVPILQNISIGTLLSGLFYLLLSNHNDPAALYHAVVSLPVAVVFLGVAAWLHWRL